MPDDAVPDEKVFDSELALSLALLVKKPVEIAATRATVWPRHETLLPRAIRLDEVGGRAPAAEPVGSACVSGRQGPTAKTARAATCRLAVLCRPRCELVDAQAHAYTSSLYLHTQQLTLTHTSFLRSHTTHQPARAADQKTTVTHANGATESGCWLVVASC